MTPTTEAPSKSPVPAKAQAPVSTTAKPVEQEPNQETFPKQIVVVKPGPTTATSKQSVMVRHPSEPSSTLTSGHKTGETVAHAITGAGLDASNYGIRTIDGVVRFGIDNLYDFVQNGETVYAVQLTAEQKSEMADEKPKSPRDLMPRPEKKVQTVTDPVVVAEEEKKAAEAKK